MIFAIYDKNTYKCYFVEGESIDDFKLQPNEVIKKHNSNDITHTDIRAYNKDGSVKSLEQQVKENIIILEENQIIKENQIYTLNKNIQDDYIIMIEKGLEKLNDRQKIVTNNNGKKYITSKTYEELFKENLITAEEYNNYIISIRQGQYQSNLDGARAELLESVLNNLASQGLLTEEQKQELESLNNKRQEIKTQYPKEN